MGICSRALYLDLLGDFDDILPGSVIDDLKQGHHVEPWIGITPRQRAALGLAGSLLKKFQDGISASADKAALDKFLACNSKAKEWVLPSDRSMKDDLLWGMFKNKLYKFFHPSRPEYLVSSREREVTRILWLPDQCLFSSWQQILAAGRLGPGSSVGANGQDFYTKLFSSPLTFTKQFLYDEYRRHCALNPTWADAELARHQVYGERVVEGNRLSFVPKNRDISRTICTEPTLNMFYQLGMEVILRERLKQVYSIDLSTQPFRNQVLAKLGSEATIPGCGYSTIDLASASDSMSLEMLRSALPKDVIHWFESVRSPVTLLEDSKCELHILSTMGNGYTFPLQTVIFLCALDAVYELYDLHLRRPRGSDSGNFGVFGDDIICYSFVYNTLCSFLGLLGFTVNSTKSFCEGPFRESCGHDYFCGYDVRGVYIKTLQSQQDRYVAINRLLVWSAKHGIPLWRTISRLKTYVQKIYVPRWDSDDAGIKVPICVARGHFKYYKPTQSIRYRRWAVRVKSLNVTDDAVLSPRGSKKRMYNTSGLLIAFVGGYLRTRKISIRLDVRNYGLKWGIAPNWDAIPSGPDQLDQVGWRRWETYVLSSF